MAKKDVSKKGRAPPKMDTDKDAPSSKRELPSPKKEKRSAGKAKKAPNGAGTAVTAGGDKKEDKKKKVTKKRSTAGLTEEKLLRAQRSAQDAQCRKWYDEDPGATKMAPGQKFVTLVHNGPYFPPAYVPHGIPLVYNGKDVALLPHEEEAATHFASKIGTVHYKNKIFTKNFWDDFVILLNTDPSTKMLRPKKHVCKKFALADFSKILANVEATRDARKRRSKEEKMAEKRSKESVMDRHGYATLNGHKERVGNYNVELPGLFMGRGGHPKSGCIKRRLLPEDITINIHKGAPVPEAPKGHSWGEVVHKNDVTWLAYWKETINGNYKYMMMHASSSLKGNSDKEKFMKARELKKHITKIRADRDKMLSTGDLRSKQLAAACWIIDVLALRAGHEKNLEAEADTVGTLNLRAEHFSFHKPKATLPVFTGEAKEQHTLQRGAEVVTSHRITLDFLGKDSVRYLQTFTCPANVFKVLRALCKVAATPSSDVFDQINATTFNKYLTGYMSGLSAKVFRTYNASVVCDRLLRTDAGLKKVTTVEKIKFFNDANREVAIMCNHQKGVGLAHGGAMAGQEAKIKLMKMEVKEFQAEVQIYGKGKISTWNKIHLRRLRRAFETKKTRAAAMYERLCKAAALEGSPEPTHLKPFTGSKADYEAAVKVLEDKAKAAHPSLIKNSKKLYEAAVKAAYNVYKSTVGEGEKVLSQEKWVAAGLFPEYVEPGLKFKKPTHLVSPPADAPKDQFLAKPPTKASLAAKIASKNKMIAKSKTLMSQRESLARVSLGTSKTNYIDPRIILSFQKRNPDVPLAKLLNKTLQDKFMWALREIEAAEKVPYFEF